MQRIPARSWWALVVVGLVGQVAWTVENMYLNLFVYDTITDSPGAIAVMVAASAIAATLAAFVVGAWSDRVGRRRVFIAVGYVLWGLSTMAFGLVNRENVGRLVPIAGAVAAAVVAIVIVDAVMSFLGAGANDAAFNAWVTDITDVDNRGRVEGVLHVMPLVAMLLVFGALDGMTQAGQWSQFFVLVGPSWWSPGCWRGSSSSTPRATCSPRDPRCAPWRPRCARPRCAATRTCS